MTNEQLCAELAPLTKLKDPRDQREFQQLKGTWPEGFPVLPDVLVDAALTLMLGLAPAERVGLLQHWVGNLPLDVTMILNQQLIKRPAFAVTMREIHEYHAAREAK